MVIIYIHEEKQGKARHDTVAFSLFFTLFYFFFSPYVFFLVDFDL